MIGMCQTNCYFVYEEGQKDVIFIDPADRGGYIYETMKEHGFNVAGILLTHGHFDHIWGSKELRELSGAKIYAYEGENYHYSISGCTRYGMQCTRQQYVPTMRSVVG